MVTYELIPLSMMPIYMVITVNTHYIFYATMKTDDNPMSSKQIILDNDVLHPPRTIWYGVYRIITTAASNILIRLLRLVITPVLVVSYQMVLLGRLWYEAMSFIFAPFQCMCMYAL